MYILIVMYGNEELQLVKFRTSDCKRKTKPYAKIISYKNYRD